MAADASRRALATATELATATCIRRCTVHAVMLRHAGGIACGSGAGGGVGDVCAVNTAVAVAKVPVAQTAPTCDGGGGNTVAALASQACGSSAGKTRWE